MPELRKQSSTDNENFGQYSPRCLIQIKENALAVFNTHSLGSVNSTGCWKHTGKKNPHTLQAIIASRKTNPQD